MKFFPSLAVMASLCGSTPAAAQAPALSIKDVFALVHEPPTSFERIWEQRFDTAAKDARGETLDELRAARARGYIDFAYFHWRETGQALSETWVPRRRAEAAVDINDAQALDRAEHRAFLDAWLRAEARTRLASEAALQTGDNRWLRARFASTADTEPLRAAVADMLAQSQGHRIETYKTIDGVTLEAHVFAPTSADGPSPALVWFHGGSWNSGSWAHCPTVCRAARDRNYVVIQVEYRTDERFASGPLAMIEDARDAVGWVRAHAAELGVNPARVVVAAHDRRPGPRRRRDACRESGRC